jgi:hypothetical protein
MGKLALRAREVFAVEVNTRAAMGDDSARLSATLCR